MSADGPVERLENGGMHEQASCRRLCVLSSRVPHLKLRLDFLVLSVIVGLRPLVRVIVWIILATLTSYS